MALLGLVRSRCGAAVGCRDRVQVPAATADKVDEVGFPIVIVPELLELIGEALIRLELFRTRLIKFVALPDLTGKPRALDQDEEKEEGDAGKDDAMGGFTTGEFQTGQLAAIEEWLKMLAGFLSANIAQRPEHRATDQGDTFFLPVPSEPLAARQSEAEGDQETTASMGSRAAAPGGRVVPKGPRKSTGDAQLAGNSEMPFCDDTDSSFRAEHRVGAHRGRELPKGARKSTGVAQRVGNFASISAGALREGAGAMQQEDKALRRHDFYLFSFYGFGRGSWFNFGYNCGDPNGDQKSVDPEGDKEWDVIPDFGATGVTHSPHGLPDYAPVCCAMEGAATRRRGGSTSTTSTPSASAALGGDRETTSATTVATWKWEPRLSGHAATELFLPRTSSSTTLATEGDGDYCNMRAPFETTLAGRTLVAAGRGDPCGGTLWSRSSESSSSELDGRTGRASGVFMSVMSCFPFASRLMTCCCTLASSDTVATRKCEARLSDSAGTELFLPGTSLASTLATESDGLPIVWATPSGTSVAGSSHPEGRTGLADSVFMSVMSCCAFGVRLMQCIYIPMRQLSHDWKCGARIGEATNPGPPSSSPSPGGLLDGLGLKEMIREMVREAVKEAIREAFGSGFLAPPEPAAARAKSRGRGDKPDKGKGKGKDVGKDKPAKAKGTDDAPRRSPKPGKGSGDAVREKPQHPSKEEGDGEWKTVERKTSGKEFVLRQQDWDAPLTLYGEVSAALDKIKPDEVFRAVVRCDQSQRTLLQRVLQGSSRKYSVLTVTLGKEEGQDPKTQQRVPGRQGDLLAFRAATVLKITSAEQSAPQPKGMHQAAVKLVKKPTEVLVVRVSKNFATKELWDAFVKSPQRSVQQWLADRHVNALDSFSWKDEKGDNHGHQLYGLVRLLQPEALAILGSSGQDGVFLDPTKSMGISGRITWVERSSKTESHSDYHARAIKCAGDLGLVAKGSRLAIRCTIQSGDIVPKIWIFEHVPVSVDPEQAKAILEKYFSDVTMMRARGFKGERTFFFKAAHPSDPNSDLVPINLDTGDGVITTWARVAPPRTEKFKQRQLPTTALPLEQKQTFRAANPVAVPVATDADEEDADLQGDGEGDEQTDKDGKSRDKPAVTAPAAKRAAVAPELRPIPEGLRKEDQPKDGACGFHCFSAGLKLISKGKIEKHPRILRAECIEHMQKHAEEYKAAWDSKGPDGRVLDSWDTYITAVSSESAYISDLELKAMARLYDVKVVLVPEMACFPPVVFHSGQKSPKRCLIFWYSGRHLDLLLVEEGKKIPKEIAEITATINFELRVGGDSSSASGSWGPRTVLTKASDSSSSWHSQAGTAWTKKSGTATQGPPPVTSGGRRTKATASQGFEEVEEAEPALQTSTRRVFHWQQHGVRKTPKFFRCQLCPYVAPVKDATELCWKRSNHCRRVHNGEGLPGYRKRTGEYITPIRGPRDNYAWTCPLCPYGLANKLRSALNATTVLFAKRRHRAEHHPKITPAKWHQLCVPRGQRRAAQRITKFNCNVAKNLTEDMKWQADSLENIFTEARAVIGGDYVDFVEQFQAEAFSLQQLDIADVEVTSYTTAWKKAGAQLFLSRPEAQTGRRRVGLVTTLHARALRMPPESLAATRVAAAIVQVQSGGQPVPLVLGAFYGFPSDSEATDQVVQQFLDVVRPLRCMYVLFGDFNWQRGEAGLIDSLLSLGRLRCLDDDFVGILPNTSPSRTRRIDFAVAHPGIAATQVCHVDGPADHVAVGYTLNLDLNFSGHRLPLRAPMDAGLSEEAIAGRFNQVWSASDFDQCLQHGRIDDAWGCLSGAAERALGVSPGASAPRAFDPTPESNEGERRHLRRPRHSRGLGGLRRLLRRLRQLAMEPEDFRLRRSIKASLGGLRELVPELPYFPGDLLEAADEVAKLVHQYEAQETEARVDAWRNTDRSYTTSCAWIKRKADEAQACFGQPKELREAVATHPTQVLREQGAIWSALWTRSSDTPFNPEPLRKVLSELPRPVDTQVDLAVSADGLSRATQRMVKKACGSDGWQARDLLRLPVTFWEAAATLWNRALEIGVLPTTWTSALVVLLPKADGRTRPVGLLSILWRAGARCLVKQLRGWVGTWTTAQAMGGVAGVGVADSHLRLMGAHRRGCRAFVKQDLSHFFDSLTLDVLLPLLEHYKAPAALCRLVAAMYRDSRRLFKVEQFTTESFTTANRGVVQGCPLSPVLSLLVGQAWASYSVLHTQEIQSLVYIDDRLLWPVSWSQRATEAMRQVLQRSDFFDAALCLQCKPEKCALAHHDQALDLVPLMQERGYPCCHTLEFLGIQFDLTTAQCVPLKLNLDKVKWRLRYLKRVGVNLTLQKLLLSSLVSAALFWAGGVAKPSDEDLKSVTNELYFFLQGSFLREAPKVLIHELMGWRSEPQFACDIAAFQAVTRHLSRTPEWRDQVPLTEAFDNWQDVLPLAAQAVVRCGWQVVRHGRALQRVDDQGRVRTFEFGWDNLEILEEWLRVEYRRKFMARCGRVQQSYHRPGNFAGGLDLPAPGNLDYSFLGHKKVFEGASSLPQRRAAAATGGTVWHWTAGSTLEHGDPRGLCLCGQWAPSRAHLTWKCEATAMCRAGVRQPRHRAEERLFACGLPQWPPAPVALDEEDFVEGIAEAVGKAAVEAEQVSGGAFEFQDFSLPENTVELEGTEQELWMVAATDGSARDGVAGYSVVFPGGRGGGMGDGSEDQSSFRAELKALLVLFRAVLLASDNGLPPRVLWVVVDCKAALDSLANPVTSCLPLLASAAANHLKSLQRRGWQVRPFWCPSHGKRREWQAPFPLRADLCRLLNEAADGEAKRAMERRRTGSLRSRWQAEAEQVCQWEEKAILAAAHAGQTYGESVIKVTRLLRAGAHGDG
ncbi:Ptchd3 [Symbiodinium sp. CCMP2592]|nr:Ptchd3 [Symbiodinium sp. CCMP2592]